MGKILNILLAIAYLILATGKAGAQDMPPATSGSTQTYNVTGLANSSFVWEVNDTGAIINNRGDSVDITWNVKGGTYEIKVTEITEFNCYGTPITANIQIFDGDIEWDNFEQFECPFSDNYTPNILKLTATYDGFLSPGASWKYVYSINGFIQPEVTVTEVKTSEYELSSSLYTNSSSMNNAVHKIKLIKLITPDGYTYDYSSETEDEAKAENRLFILTISPKPATSGIKMVSE